VRVWDAATGGEVLAIPVQKSLLRSLAYSPDGKRIAVAGLGRTVKVFDAATGKEVLTLRGHTGQLAEAGADQTVRVWDAATGGELLALRGPTSSLWAVASSPDGRRLASAGMEHAIRVWDATPPAPDRQVP
jgi:WD40 repeat protein